MKPNDPPSIPPHTIATPSLAGVFAIAEDDSELRSALVLWFSMSGLRCEGFESAEQFLEFYRVANGHSFLLLGSEPGTEVPLLGAVIDIHLPGLNGNLLASDLHQHDPSLPMVLMSALTLKDRETFGRVPNGVQCFKKPFEIHELMSALFTPR